MLMGKLPGDEMLRDMLSQGLTQAEVAGMYGVTRQAVSWRMGHKPRARSRRAPGKMTATRRAVLEAIIAYKRANDGNAPTVRELSETVGRAYSVIYQHLRVLEQLGRIRLLGDRWTARRICVVGGRWELEVDDATDGNAAR